MAPKFAGVSSIVVANKSFYAMPGFKYFETYPEDQIFDDSMEISAPDAMELFGKLFDKDDLSYMLVAFLKKNKLESDPASIVLTTRSGEKTIEATDVIVKVMNKFSTATTMKELLDYDMHNIAHRILFRSIIDKISKKDAEDFSKRCSIVMSYNTGTRRARDNALVYKPKTITMLRDDIKKVFGLAAEDDDEEDEETEEENKEDLVKQTKVMNIKKKMVAAKKRTSEWHQPFGVPVHRDLNDIAEAQGDLDDLEQQLEQLNNPLEQHSTRGSSSNTTTAIVDDPFVDEDKQKPVKNPYKKRQMLQAMMPGIFVDADIPDEPKEQVQHKELSIVPTKELRDTIMATEEFKARHAVIVAAMDPKAVNVLEIKHAARGLLITMIKDTYIFNNNYV